MPESPATKNCFVISPIGEMKSETRLRADQILKHIIRPAAEACGYTAARADEIDKPGLITSQVIQRVVNDPLVIADLTESNPNVFYELAVRHAIRKPVVQIIRKGDKIPFDVAASRTILVDHQDLDSAAQAKSDIERQIREIENSTDSVETPISVSVDLFSLKTSENPEQRSIAEIMSEISSLKSAINISSNVVEEKIARQFERIDDRMKFLRAGGSSSNLMAMKFRKIIDSAIFESLTQLDRERLILAISGAQLRGSYPWLAILATEASNHLAFKRLEEGRYIISILQADIALVKGTLEDKFISPLDAQCFDLIEDLLPF